MAKTLYHGELAKRGPVAITVKNNPQPSQKKKGTYYIPVILDGEERYLNPENEAILAFFQNTAGRTFTLHFAGSGKDGSAAVTYIGEATPQQTAPTPQPVPPPASGATSFAPPPPPPGGANVPPHQPAAPPLQQAAPPAHPQGLKPQAGQRVGNAMTNAVNVLVAIGVDPTSPKFYEETYFIASNLCRVAEMIENGRLAVNAKERSAGQH